MKVYNYPPSVIFTLPLAGHPQLPVWDPCRFTGWVRGRDTPWCYLSRGGGRWLVNEARTIPCKRSVPLHWLVSQWGASPLMVGGGEDTSGQLLMLLLLTLQTAQEEPPPKCCMGRGAEEEHEENLPPWGSRVSILLSISTRYPPKWPKCVQKWSKYNFFHPWWPKYVTLE